MIIENVFHVERGKGGYRESLEFGNTPLVSATCINNGVLDFVDADPIFKAPCITVERVGGNAFVQPVDFITVPDDISVLIPKEEMSLETLFYVAVIINSHKWKYNYGRKLTGTRLKKIEITLSNFKHNDIDFNRYVKLKYESSTNKLDTNYSMNSISFEKFTMESLFSIKSGDYHVASELDEGSIPLVSCGEINNGIIGYYDIPEKNQYSHSLTVAYNGKPLTSFYHSYVFGTKDDVAICTPKKTMPITTLIFIQFQLNEERWRFSYGRKCYRAKLMSTKINLPVDEDGEIAHQLIKKLVINSTYWENFKELCSTQTSNT